MTCSLRPQVVAIVLFVIKGFIDARGRAADRERKAGAVRRLLAMEFERNHWTLVRFFEALETFRDLRDDEQITVDTSRGREGLRIEDSQGWSGFAVPGFHTALYQRLLPELAELDASLYELVSDMYEHLNALADYRQGFLDYLRGDGDEAFRGTAKPFFSDLAGDKDDELGRFKAVYKEVSGKEVEHGQWRL